MWPANAGPGHSATQSQTRMSKKSISEGVAAAPSTSELSSHTYGGILQHHNYHHHHHAASAFDTQNIADLLEPAVDGPPSPGRIRALSNRVKQAYMSERHVSQQTTSPGSSLLSLALIERERRPSWEQALETFSLSRKSSTRSNTSSMPPRDRPESVQAIGKAIFKARFRRESLATSGSSGYSSDMAADGTGERARASSISKEHGLSLFSRRKTVQAGEDTSAPKKPLISSPFNFQHVTQIQRDDLERANRATLQHDMSGLRASHPPPPGPHRGMQAEDLRLPNFSSRSTRPHDDDESIAPHVVPHSRNNSITRPLSFQKSPPRQSVKHMRSQDHFPGVAPPRPPRSPTELDLNFDFIAPMPPPRHPKRPSIPRRDSEALGNIMGSQYQGMGGFRFPPITLQTDATSPPPTSDGCSSPKSKEERRYSRIYLPSPAENPNWPLPCPSGSTSTIAFEAALPDVPEEEEQSGLPRRSHAKSGSNNSSLRGSQSVPALRKVSVSNYGRNNRESVVFGNFGLAATERATRETVIDSKDESDPLPRDSWEDVIDYCYEHEAEADCDYDWHRPSVELEKEPTVLITESEIDDVTLYRPASDRFEMPALSPSSHLSIGSSHSQEAITPTMPAPGAPKSPTSANFSLPRRDGVQPQRLLGSHSRTVSQASSFKEQEFTLSPSMLIPNDYRQELLLHQNEQYNDPDSFAHAVTYEEPTLTMETSNLFVPARSSSSTTASASNMSSQSAFDRHISSNSMNTDYTRLTMSTGSVELDPFIFKDDTPQEEQEEPVNGECLSPDHIASMMTPHARSQSIAGLLNSSSRPLSRDNHNSDSNLAGLHSKKRQVGRDRSRTMSSTPPPSGQYALFPTTNAKGL